MFQLNLILSSKQYVLKEQTFFLLLDILLILHLNYLVCFAHLKRVSFPSPDVYHLNLKTSHISAKLWASDIPDSELPLCIWESQSLHPPN